MTTEKALIIAVTALAGVIVYLFKLYVSQGAAQRAADTAHAKEREGWALERAQILADHLRERTVVDEQHKRELDKLAADAEHAEQELRLEGERRHRELVERYDAAARRESEIFRAHEDQVRKEFAGLMEKVAAEAAKSSDALVQMLQRFYDRLVGPRGY